MKRPTQKKARAGTWAKKKAVQPVSKSKNTKRKKAKTRYLSYFESGFNGCW